MHKLGSEYSRGVCRKGATEELADQPGDSEAVLPGLEGLKQVWGQENGDNGDGLLVARLVQCLGRWS